MNEQQKHDVLGIEDRPLPDAVFLANVQAAREAFLAGATTPRQYEVALARAFDGIEWPLGLVDGRTA